MTNVEDELLNFNEPSRTQMGTTDVRQINIDSCIVCNNVTNLYEQNVGELRSQHSDTRICDLIQRCLGASKLSRNIDTVSNYPCICCDCISKLNEYDLAWVTAEHVGYELQQMLLQTDQLRMEGPHWRSADSKFCCDDNDNADDTSDYCLGKVEVFETTAPPDHDEDNENDDASSDAEISSQESIGNDEIQNAVDNARGKRTYECDTCPEKFNLWKELRVSKDFEKVVN